MSATDETQERHKHEMLGSVFVRGRLHACYPTALRTLCLVECLPRGELMNLQPTCWTCLRTARMPAFRADIPKDWLPTRARA